MSNGIVGVQNFFLYQIFQEIYLVKINKYANKSFIIKLLLWAKLFLYFNKNFNLLNFKIILFRQKS